jgi:UPF0716 family protein affecting phage T7 exclusion
LSPRLVRWTVLVVCVAGIAGMIVGSVADNNGVAITFGLIAAVAVLGLILVTAVSGPGAFTREGSERVPGVDEDRAALVEQRIQRLIAAGAEEAAVRDLVREAVRLGRGVGPPTHPTNERPPSGR